MRRSKRIKSPAHVRLERIRVDSLDRLDRDSMKEAIFVRLGAMSDPASGAPCLPDGTGTLESRAIAEICRGWLEMLANAVAARRAEGPFSYTDRTIAPAEAPSEGGGA